MNDYFKLFVADTTAIISYFAEIFEQPSEISKPSLTIIERAYCYDGSIRLSIPSIVFVEIFEKWYPKWTEEEIQKFKIEVFLPTETNENIEIKPIEKEVLEHFITLDDSRISLENHDKIIMASAMMLDCPLITSDKKIIRYAKRKKQKIRVLS